MLSVEPPRTSTEHCGGGRSTPGYAPPPSPNEGGSVGASPSAPWGHCMRMCTAPGRALCALLPILITPPHSRSSPGGERPTAGAPSRVATPSSHCWRQITSLTLPPHTWSPSLPLGGAEHPTHDRALALCVLSSDDKPATEAEPPATTISLHPYPLHPPEDGSGGDGGEGEEVRHEASSSWARRTPFTSPSPRPRLPTPPLPRLTDPAGAG